MLSVCFNSQALVTLPSLHRHTSSLPYQSTTLSFLLNFPQQRQQTIASPSFYHFPIFVVSIKSFALYRWNFLEVHFIIYNFIIKSFLIFLNSFLSHLHIILICSTIMLPFILVIFSIFLGITLRSDVTLFGSDVRIGVNEFYYCAIFIFSAISSNFLSLSYPFELSNDSLILKLCMRLLILINLLFAPHLKCHCFGPLQYYLLYPLNFRHQCQ